MDWLTSILKDLPLSRSATGAGFITAAFLYWGPKLYPTLVEPAPKEFTPALLAVLVFTGALLFFWAVAGAWECARTSASWFARTTRSKSLTNTEQFFLLTLARDPSAPLNLETLNYSNMLMSKLEVVQLAHGLQQRGLVELNMFDETLVTLSKAGRARALEIQRRYSQKNAP